MGIFANPGDLIPSRSKIRIISHWFAAAD